MPKTLPNDIYSQCFRFRWFGCSSKEIEDTFGWSQALAREVAGNSVRILVRSCPVLNALACTWQSHVALQVVKTTGYSHTEKAGVGGSTPSLATIFSIT
jgi:hypothetical protein